MPLSTLLGHTADAVQAVLAGRSLTEVLGHCPSAARAGTQALSFEVLRRLGFAQAVRRLLAPKNPPPALDALLLTALALLAPENESDTPDAPSERYEPHTLVNQAVAAARARQAASSGFVNAVLRRFLREHAHIVQSVMQQPVAAFNHPAWWITRLQQDWPEHWQAMLAHNNQRAPMTLRVSSRHATAQNYLAQLQAMGMGGTIAGAQAIVLDKPCPVNQLPGFDLGHVSVQDAAAQWAAPWLLGLDADAGLPPLPKGARVLDACAAPGGKTTHLLELADVQLTALDQDAARLSRVGENLARLGLKAQLQAADASQPNTWWDGQLFDAILLDAPCSASGIVRRHPDVRWLRRETDIAALSRIQAQLLDALWPLLAPGGRLLYCTCSVFKAEGQDQIDAFLQRQSGALCLTHAIRPGHHLPLHDNQSLPEKARVDVQTQPMGMSADGFFYALLIKTTALGGNPP
ncbi:MAG: 16S rRNA (cytosine(967)-C(5))-methyltransferase RsmB [Rhizobacter sp.]